MAEGILLNLSIIAKLSPSLSSSWAELVLFSVLPRPDPTRPDRPTDPTPSRIVLSSLYISMLSKAKLISMTIRTQKSFWAWPQPQNLPRRAQKGPKGPNWGWVENKKIELYFQNLKWYSTLVGTKKFAEPDPNEFLQLQIYSTLNFKFLQLQISLTSNFFNFRFLQLQISSTQISSTSNFFNSNFFHFQFSSTLNFFQLQISSTVDFFNFKFLQL